VKRITILSLAASIGCCVMSFTPTTTDDSFAGVIKYSITVDGASNPQAAQMMQNSTFTIYLASGKAKSVFAFSMGTQSSLSGVIPDSVISLRDIGGQKVEMKIPISNKAIGGKNPDIKYLDDTKEIAGYTCHRAQVTNANGTTTDVYYTDQLPAYEGKKGEYKGLKGFPLEFSSTERGGMTVKFSAISVTKQALSDDVFAVPSGYTLQAMPAMGQHGMGGGQ